MTREAMMPIVEVLVCPMTNPADTSAMEKALLRSKINPNDIIAVIGKSEGNGLPNDYGRLLADIKIRELLAKHRETSPETISEQVTIAMSGGAPGTVAPHATILAQRWTTRTDKSNLEPTGGIVLGRSHTTDILPEHIGRVEQVDAVTAAVNVAIADAGITDIGQVHMVLVKGPALTHDSIAVAEIDGVDLVTKDPGIGPMGSMCYSNDAMAIGVGVATGEINRSDVTNESIRKNWSLYSNVALTSSGGEKRKAEILVIANHPASLSRYRAGHGISTGIGDTSGIKTALRSAGLAFECCPDQAQKERISQIFAKFTLPATAHSDSGKITLLEDHEAHHVAKAVGGALVTSITGLKMVFISGGEANSHMGPPNGNPVCAIVKI